MIRFFLTVFLAAAGLTVSCAGQDESAPRYKFQVGEELVYESSSTFNFTRGGGTQHTDRFTYWVSRENADGSWHVIVQKSATQQVFDQPSLIPQNYEQLSAFDVFPDGSLPTQPDVGGTLACIIPLPKDRAAASAGWEDARIPVQTQVYRLAANANLKTGNWIFERRNSKGIFNTIHPASSHDVIVFDASRGLITKITSEKTQRYGFFMGKGTGETDLKSVTMRDPGWIQKLSSEVDGYFQAKNAFDEAVSANERAGADAAATALQTARNAATLPVIQSQYDQALNEFSWYKKYLGQKKKAILNQPAPEWKATDLSGKEHDLTEYRGKIVVLDFWYRGCGWCMIAMPQVKEVAEYFRNKPVVVLGMCTDHNEKDAQFVADKLALDYPVLMAEGLPEKYGVEGFPTLFVIDRNGIVRDRHVGYSATLRDDLVKTIDGLLAETGK